MTENQVIIENCIFTPINNGTAYELTRYTGNAPRLRIPDVLNDNKPVIRIAAYAFYGCKSITDIILQENIREIGDSAFRDCTELRYIKIPASASSQGKDIFAGCSPYLKIDGINDRPANNYPPAGGYPPVNSYPPTGGYSQANNYPPASGYPPVNNYPPASGYSQAKNYPPASGYSQVNSPEGVSGTGHNKDPKIALLFSFICDGLGQMYCGWDTPYRSKQTKKGIIYLVVYIILFLIGAVLAVIVIPLFIAIAWHIINIIDAYNTANMMKNGVYSDKFFNLKST